MSGPEIDYEAVFQATASPVLLLTPGLVIADANQAYERATGRSRERLVGRPLFDVFPDDPDDPRSAGVANLRASLERVLASGEPDSMALQRHDVEAPGWPGVMEERWWSPVNSPVLGPDGRVAVIVHRAEDVTDLVRRGRPGGDPRLRAMEADLYARAEELHDLNERLREAHAREREVALALQESMLHAPGPVVNGEVAVRYRPASSGLNVCGDWYDLVDLPGDRLAVAVGDVVGHGLEAAGVMGQLRSALSAAIRVAEGPAQALRVLGLYAGSVKGAEATTAVQAIIDWPARAIVYSCAGHPPPALLRGDGQVEFLDQATEPPLDSRPGGEQGAQSAVRFAVGDTLVLYTDGLIERRGEGIDAGLSRLARSLVRGLGMGPESLADSLLAALGVGGEPTDDTALVVIRL